MSLATHLPLRAVQGESTEIFEFFSENSVISVAKEVLAHSFRYSLFALRSKAAPIIKIT